MKEEDSFKPFIPAGKALPELTGTSIITGILMAILFGAANAYLGLRVGMTVSASIPAAVISMGVLRVVLKRNSILENNIVQTIGSAGESVAAGAIFTMPALFMWSAEWQTAPPSFLEISLIAFCGGAMGILFMVPLRRALIVKEHHVLPYPEGTACAEVLLAGERRGSGAATVFSGLGVSAIYKFFADGVRLFPSKIHFELPLVRGAGVGADLLPALTGVGYICGPKISGYMMSGGVLGWLCLMPLLSLFGGDAVLFPGETPVGLMGSEELWRNYIRYIGAGAVAAGGIMSLIKALPLISRTFIHAMKDYTQKGPGGTDSRTDADLPTKLIGLGLLALIAIIWFAPVIPVTISGAVIIAVFGFFFATVSSRLVGLVGSSNNPVSGMTIATLLIATLLLKLLGNTSHTGMIGAIAIGSVISIITAVAGDTSQDLKTGYLLGATPKSSKSASLSALPRPPWLSAAFYTFSARLGALAPLTFPPRKPF